MCISIACYLFSFDFAYIFIVVLVFLCSLSVHTIVFLSSTIDLELGFSAL